MHSPRVVLRFLVVVPVVAAATMYVLTKEPVRGVDLGSRLVSFEPLPEATMESCTWDVAAPERVSYQGARAGGGATRSGPAMGDPQVAARMPVHDVRDPYAGFAAIRVDPVHNEVVVMDEFKFNIYVYDRLATTTASAERTTPKRFIGGGKTLSRYNSDGYVDTKTGDIYIVNNDSEPGMFKFPRTAEGNVEPASELVTPYGAFGMTVDEDRGEVFVTIQHDGAIQIFKKGAKGNDNAIRLIQGNLTGLADPHGIAFDPKTRLLYVANYGTERDETFGVDQPMPNPLNSLTPRGNNTRRPNWPAGNLNNADRREVVFGSGKFGPPSITVFAADANGNIAPVRAIKGPKAQLNWPTGISVDPDRGEVYVSNAAGDTINVFSTTANGDVAPIRQIKGSRTLLRNPNGVSVDTVNGEVWVANFGNHTATAYKWNTNGNAEPIRVIRSAPLNAPTTLINNPYMIAFDGRRDEVLVPNCVAQPRISAFSSSADKNAVPTRIIEGQNTRLNRTVHAIAYDDLHDEIVVQSNMGQAVVTYRGGANGDEAPIRIIQGPKTLLRDPQSLFIDPVHDEIFVFNMGTDDTMLVYDRTAQGDVAPKRILKSPGAIGGVGAVDPVSNLIFLSGRNNGVLVYNRTADGTTPPLRTIGGGPVSGLMRPGRIVVYPPTHSVIVTSSAGQGTRDPVTKDLTPQAYVGVWNEDDSGDVAPRWTIAKGYLYMPRGLTLDPKKKTVIVSDKYKNSVMTFSLPELYSQPAATRETARAAR